MRRHRRFKRRYDMQNDEAKNHCENIDKKTEVLIIENEEDKKNENENRENENKESKVKKEINEKNNRETKEEDFEECSILVSSNTIPIYPNKIVQLKGAKGKIVAKIPVIISQFSLQVSCEADINFYENVIEIKDVDENVYLTECNLLPKADKLFFSGYVRKSIEYSSISYRKRKAKKRPLKSVTVYIPFKGVTQVEYSTPPVVNIIKKSNQSFLYLKDDNTGNDLDEISFKHSQCLNEKIFCEMINADVFETHIIEERHECEETFGESTFEKLHQKFVINITLRLIQNQDVSII